MQDLSNRDQNPLDRMRGRVLTRARRLSKKTRKVTTPAKEEVPISAVARLLETATPERSVSELSGYTPEMASEVYSLPRSDTALSVEMPDAIANLTLDDLSSPRKTKVLPPRRRSLRKAFVAAAVVALLAATMARPKKHPPAPPVVQTLVLLAPPPPILLAPPPPPPPTIARVFYDPKESIFTHVPVG